MDVSAHPTELKLDTALAALARLPGAVVGVQPIAAQLAPYLELACAQLRVDAFVARKLVDDRLELLGSFGFDEMQPAPSLGASYGIGGRLLAERLPIAIPDVLQDQVAFPDPRSRNLGFRSYIGAPLVVGGHIIGILGGNTREVHREFSHDDMTFVQCVARHIAVIVLNEELYEER
jgi:GAF domain-containing protein